MLVSAYRKTGRSADAEKILSAALAKNKKDVDALLQRADIYFNGGQYTQAQADLNEVLYFRPDSPEAHYLLARIDQKRGADLSERQELTEALRLNPNLLRIRLELARLLITEKSPKTAIEILDQTPTSQKGLAVLIQRNWALLALGQFSELRGGIDDGLAIQKAPDLVVQNALWRLNQKDYAGAKSDIDVVLKADPSNVKALDALMKVYAVQRQLPAGLTSLKSYAARQSESGPVQKLLGTWLSAGEQKADARAAFNAAISADPQDMQSQYELVELDTAAGQYENARQRLNRLLSSHPEDTMTRLYVADLDSKEHKYSDAIAQYKQVLEANPSSVVALNNLAYILTNSGHPHEAIALAQQAREMMPNNSAVSDTIGWTLYQKGMYGLAIRQLEEATRASPDATIKYHLAIAYLKNGDRSKGRAMFELAHKLAPDAPESVIAGQLLAQ